MSCLCSTKQNANFFYAADDKNFKFDENFHLKKLCMEILFVINKVAREKFKLEIQIFMREKVSLVPSLLSVEP